MCIGGGGQPVDRSFDGTVQQLVKIGIYKIANYVYRGRWPACRPQF